MTEGRVETGPKAPLPAYGSNSKTADAAKRGGTGRVRLQVWRDLAVQLLVHAPAATIILALSTPPAALAAGAPAVTILAGHRYRFDPSAFEGGVVETGRVGSVLLELAWPELRGLTRDEATAWPRRDTIRILANSGAAVAGNALPEPRLHAGLSREMSAAIAPFRDYPGRSGGSLAPIVAAPSEGNVKAAALPPGGDMVKLAGEQPLSGEPGTEIYAEPPLQNARQFIACSVPTPQTIASCTQTFVAASLILNVSYRRPLVRQWQDIQRRVEGFLAAHEAPR